MLTEAELAQFANGYYTISNPSPDIAALICGRIGAICIGKSSRHDGPVISVEITQYVVTYNPNAELITWSKPIRNVTDVIALAHADVAIEGNRLTYRYRDDGVTGVLSRPDDPLFEDTLAAPQISD